ncbi:SDR family NAD(P)-dependent oxidoreductase [Thermodesulfobacteriota bacterium]
MGVLDAKVAVITGAAKGLGRAIAVRFAGEGAKVVAVTDRDMEGLAETERVIREEGGDVLTLKVDVSNEDDTERMASETMARYGAIDALVNNAAIFDGLKRQSFLDISVEEWDRLMAVNVKGMWLCAKAVTPQMKTQQKGRIINIGSSVAFMSHFGFTHYLTSKAAIIGLTRSMAGELGEHGITVNNVGPGTIMTEARKVYTTDEQAMEKAQNQLIKRPPESEDITGMVVYLASDESSMMTGQTVVIDGGVVLH